jgi:deoxyribodipyrimidine photo-lyase
VLVQARQCYRIFVFGAAIHGALENRADYRIGLIWQRLTQLFEALGRPKSGMMVLPSPATVVIPVPASKPRVAADYANCAYAPTAVSREATVDAALRAQGMTFVTRKNQVIFEKSAWLPQTRQLSSDRSTAEYLTAPPSQPTFDKPARIEARQTHQTNHSHRRHAI